MNEVGQQRKIRVDMKKDTKPTVKLGLKDAIYRMAYITQTPVKEVSETMINYAIVNQEIINSFSPFFKRDIRLFNTLYIGDYRIQGVSKRDEGLCERINFRLSQNTHRVIGDWAYALDVSRSRVCALLLDATLHDFNFINMYISNYLKSQITTNQMNELQSIINYVNDKGEGEVDELTWASLLSSIVDEITVPINKLRDGINEYLIKNWKD